MRLIGLTLWSKRTLFNFLLPLRILPKCRTANSLVPEQQYEKRDGFVIRRVLNFKSIGLSMVFSV